VTKADLVAIMARASGGPKVSAERAVSTFLSSVLEALHRRERVTISGFGTFVVTRRAARNGRNPRTGRVITIPSARVPKFRPSRVLKAALR
jgi:DNA-binding protein HU-beta